MMRRKKMVVKNYSITTDTAAVESKIAELG